MARLVLRAHYVKERHGRCVEAEAGYGHLRDLLKDAHTLACKLECGICFDFNGKHIAIWPDNDPEERLAYYWHSWGFINPYPV